MSTSKLTFSDHLKLAHLYESSGYIDAVLEEGFIDMIKQKLKSKFPNDSAEDLEAKLADVEKNRDAELQKIRNTPAYKEFQKRKAAQNAQAAKANKQTAQKQVGTQPRAPKPAGTRSPMHAPATRMNAAQNRAAENDWAADLLK